jgi:hypothetical protein
LETQVNDLEALIDAAWSIMKPSQKIEFLRCEKVQNVIEASGVDDEFVPRLEAIVRDHVTKQEEAVAKLGVTFWENEEGYMWQNSQEERSIEVPDRMDCVADAYAVHVKE